MVRPRKIKVAQKKLKTLYYDCSVTEPIHMLAPQHYFSFGNTFLHGYYQQYISCLSIRPIPGDVKTSFTFS